jgi:hypothetical protein
MVKRALLTLSAATLLISTFLNWFPGGFEGAYLNRSAGKPAFSASFHVFGSNDAWQAFSVIDVLLGALVAACTVAVLLWRVAPLFLVAGGAGILGGIVLCKAFDSPVLDWVGPGPVLAFGSLVLMAATASASALQRARDG